MSPADDLIVTIEDVRSAGHCVAGAKKWFAGYGIDFRRFLADGAPASVLLATEDAYAQQVVACARERAGAGNGR